MVLHWRRLDRPAAGVNNIARNSLHWLVRREVVLSRVRVEIAGAPQSWRWSIGQGIAVGDEQNHRQSGDVTTPQGFDRNDAADERAPVCVLQSHPPYLPAGPHRYLCRPGTPPRYGPAAAPRQARCYKVDAGLGSVTRMPTPRSSRILQYMPQKHRALSQSCARQHDPHPLRTGHPHCAMHIMLLAATDEFRRKHIGLTSQRS